MAVCCMDMQFVSTTTCLVATNRELDQHFRGARGLRWGDPLSPYLFGLSLEIFLGLLHRVTSDSTFHYHSRCIILQITHMLMTYFIYQRGYDICERHSEQFGRLACKSTLAHRRASLHPSPYMVPSTISPKYSYFTRHPPVCYA